MTDNPDREVAPATGGAVTPVGSPCNSICRMDGSGVYCIGCFRTLDEIAGWSGFDDAHRRRIWEELRRRKAALAAVPLCGQPR
jgi:uncharacterized protein